MSQTAVYKHHSHFPKAAWRWPNFTPAEMACRGTGELMIDPVAMDRLQALRSRLGKPMVANSAYRSESHNRNVGGAPKSQHRLAKALDIRMAGHDPVAFAATAKECGFTGFGHYARQGFMHIDIGPARHWYDGGKFPGF